ncbi:MAG: HNH endonuclease [Rhizobiaceae bacterium]|nr:HNH endonuclease [Rhizobiaceae bacterium]
MPENSSRKQRRVARIGSRQGNRCIYCGQKFSPARPATLEHLLPRSKGGKADRDNIAVSCRECNNDKASLTHEEYIHALSLRIEKSD